MSWKTFPSVWSQDCDFLSIGHGHLGHWHNIDKKKYQSDWWRRLGCGSDVVNGMCFGVMELILPLPLTCCMMMGKLLKLTKLSPTDYMK